MVAGTVSSPFAKVVAGVKAYDGRVILAPNEMTTGRARI
jgi:hypothetical protein